MWINKQVVLYNGYHYNTSIQAKQSASMLPTHPKPYNFLQPQTRNRSDSNLVKLLQVGPNPIQTQINPLIKPNQKRILTSPEYLPAEQIVPTYSSDFVKEFQYIAGSENLFPILLQIMGDSVYVCSKDSFIVFRIDQPSNYQKIKLPQMPTSFMATEELLYFGLRSGIIIVYNIYSKTTMATCEEFAFPVIQLEKVDKDRFLGMDLCGNLKLFQVSVKTAKEHISKVSISVSDIIEQYRIKKRDKIKNFVKSLPFRKQKPQPQQSQQESASSAPLPNEQIPKFCLLSQNLRSASGWPMIYYHRGQLKCVILDEKVGKIGEEVIMGNVEGRIGMMELGEGGFNNSNQSHIILVVSVQNTIHFYRQLAVQSSLQYIKISQVPHSCLIHSGKFLSNNLLLFLTQQGIQLSNINDKLLNIHKICYDKFSYIDFFNEEEGFNFDKRLLYGNIVKIGAYGNGDCLWGCLEGKRLVLGRVCHWQNYLLAMADSYSWDKCLKSALMIYKDCISLLGSIPQRLQQRNQSMQALFQKLTLTYLSYSLKNSNNPLLSTEIVRNVIDFMVRTQCYTYLFTTLYEAIKSWGLEDVFFSNLEEYVESGTIKWMTDDILTKVVKHYTDIPSTHQILPPIPTQQHEHIPSPTSSQKQIQHDRTLAQNRHHLQTMIMSFDLSKMEKSFLLFICLNNQLYRALIYICKEQADYVTPVVKLCGLRLVKGDELNRLLQQQKHKQKEKEKEIKRGEKEDKEMEMEIEIEIEKVESGSRQRIRLLEQQLGTLSQITFFYLSQCLLGHNTQHNNTKSYLQMLQQLISFIFIPSSLLMLLQASAQYTFAILDMICGVQVMQYILENGTQLGVKKCREVYQGKEGKDGKEGEDGVDFRGILWELGLCGFRYFENKDVESFMKTNQYYPIFSPNSSQQFKIYNEMLSIVTYTILHNYSKHHSSNPYIPQLPLLNSPTTTTTTTTSSNTQKHQSQIYLNSFHNFITHLILNNSFPVRLGWRVLAYQFCLMYPDKIVGGGGQKVEMGEICQVLMRIVDSVLRDVTMQDTHVGTTENNTNTIVRFLLNPLSNKNNQILRYYECFIPIKCYLLEMLEETKEIVETLMGSTQESTRMSVFEYINNKADSILQALSTPYSPTKQPTQSPSLLQQNPPLISYLLLQKLPQLIKLSQPQALALTTKICTKLIQDNRICLEDLLKIADAFRADSQAELSFIEAVIGAYEDILHLTGDYVYANLGAVGKNMEVLAVRHLMVVVQFCPQKLSQNILKIHYPLEQAYRVCEQFNNKTAMAYVLIKSGRNQEGVLLICDLFSVNCREVFRNLAKNTESETTASQMEKMEMQLNKILETCCNQYINDTGKGEELFEKVLEKLFKQLNPRVIDNIPIIKIRDLLQQYINKIITMTFSLVNPEFFTEKFSKNSKLMTIPTRLYIQAYNLVCSRLGFDYEINFMTKELFRQGEMKMNKDILRNNCKGLVVEEDHRCAKCQLLLFSKQDSAAKEQVQQKYEQKKQEGPIIIYVCGHQFHSLCLNAIQSQMPDMEKPKQKSPSKSSSGQSSQQKRAKPTNINFCPNCKYTWSNMISQELQCEADRYTVGVRQRQKAIFIERKNKLSEFDLYDWYGVKGEVYGRYGQRVF